MMAYKTRSDTLKLQRLIEVLKERGSETAGALEDSATDFLNDVKPKYKPGEIPHYDGDESDGGSSYVEDPDNDESWGSGWEEDWEDCKEELPPEKVTELKPVPPTPPPTEDEPKATATETPLPPPPPVVKPPPKQPSPVPIKKVTPAPMKKPERTQKAEKEAYRPAALMSGVEASSAISSPLMKFPTLQVNIPNLFGSGSSSGNSGPGSARKPPPSPHLSSRKPEERKKQNVPSDTVEAVLVDSMAVATAIVMPNEPTITQVKNSKNGSAGSTPPGIRRVSSSGEETMAPKVPPRKNSKANNTMTADLTEPQIPQDKPDEPLPYIPTRKRKSLSKPDTSEQVATTKQQPENTSSSSTIVTQETFQASIKPKPTSSGTDKYLTTLSTPLPPPQKELTLPPPREPTPPPPPPPKEPPPPPKEPTPPLKVKEPTPPPPIVKTPQPTKTATLHPPKESKPPPKEPTPPPPPKVKTPQPPKIATPLSKEPTPPPKVKTPQPPKIATPPPKEPTPPPPPPPKVKTAPPPKLSTPPKPKPKPKPKEPTLPPPPPSTGTTAPLPQKVETPPPKAKEPTVPPPPPSKVTTQPQKVDLPPPKVATSPKPKEPTTPPAKPKEPTLPPLPPPKEPTPPPKAPTPPPLLPPKEPTPPSKKPIPPPPKEPTPPPIILPKEPTPPPTQKTPTSLHKQPPSLLVKEQTPVEDEPKAVKQKTVTYQIPPKEEEVVKVEEKIPIVNQLQPPTPPTNLPPKSPGTPRKTRPVIKPQPQLNYPVPEGANIPKVGGQRSKKPTLASKWRMQKEKQKQEEQSLLDRIDTFVDPWPYEEEDESVPSVSVLAEAGFYFIGLNDCVQCSSCELVLSGWNVMDKSNNDPWQRHAMDSPQCSYLEKTKGADWIKQITEE